MPIRKSLYELLESRLSKADFDAVMALIKNMSGTSGYDREDASLQAIGAEAHHSTQIFPEDTDETVIFTAGGVDNEFGAWAEIIDNNAVTFSSKITHFTHLTAFLIENVNIKDKVYLFEIAYGGDKIIVARYRFLAGETPNLPAVQQVRIRSDHLPPGETVYYRMKCESADKTCQLHIRYYQHD